VLQFDAKICWLIAVRVRQQLGHAILAYQPGGDLMIRRGTRREFVATLGSAAAAWPVMVRGQQPGMPTVGYLHQGSPSSSNTPQLHFEMV
jgi:hypothetical protein